MGESLCIKQDLENPTESGMVAWVIARKALSKCMMDNNAEGPVTLAIQQPNSQSLALKWPNSQGKEPKIALLCLIFRQWFSLERPLNIAPFGAWHAFGLFSRAYFIRRNNCSAFFLEANVWTLLPYKETGLKISRQKRLIPNAIVIEVTIY